MDGSFEQRSRFGAAPGLADRIGRHIEARGLRIGEHLSAQVLADLFSASRTPVTNALRLLASRGLVRHEPRRGFFVDDCSTSRRSTQRQVDPIQAAYDALVRDRLTGRLDGTVRERELLDRYRLTKSQLNILLSRIATEGWIERRAGYGWSFTEMLTTAEALSESFRLRRTLEPASLLEPGYHFERDAASECRRAELAVLNGGFATLSREALFDQRAMFHEFLVSGSRNRFFLDTIRRVNRIRRLLSYQAMDARERYVKQCEEHLHLLDLLERGRNEDAAEALRRHLDGVERHYASTLAGQEQVPPGSAHHQPR